MVKQKSTYKKGDTVRREFLIKAKRIKSLSLDPILSIVKYEGKKYLIERIGKCDYQKCGNACCKFIYIGGSSSYWKGFGKINQITKGIVIKKKCSRLNRNGRCDLFGRKKFSGECKQFPHSHDEVYHIVYNKCGFRFKIIEKIK